MKEYQVVWTEKMSLNIEANNAEEAIDVVTEATFDPAKISSEIDTEPRAYELHYPNKGKE